MRARRRSHAHDAGWRSSDLSFRASSWLTRSARFAAVVSLTANPDSVDQLFVKHPHPGIELFALLGDAAFHAVEPVIHLLESPINLLESPINLLESPINLLEARVNLLEARVNLLEARVNLLEAA